MIAWADVVHLTGTYSFPTIPTLALAHVKRRPVLWSPRGALLASHTWDGSSRRRMKRIWENICHAVAPERTMLHVTSEDEKTASLARLSGMRAIVIPNGVEIPPPSPSRISQPGGVLRVMFLGRLDPVKGIANLIEAIRLVTPGVARLDLYGTGDADYVAELKRLVATRGLDNVTRFHGHVEGDQKSQAFAEADVCVLASYSENFGMVVAEALAHGVPVIVSRGVPWSEVEQRRCGRWVDNSPASLADAISSMRHRNLEEMGAAGRRWMEAEFDWNAIADRTLEAMCALCQRALHAEPADARSRTRAAP
jgi:glycosyltransferase involved in cell wall biosynthesis